MRRICWSILAFSVYLNAQSFDRAKASAGYDSIRVEDLRADLTLIASPAFEGRMSLQKGSEAAMEWIASEYAKAGLKPVAGTSYFQKIALIEYRTDREASSFAVLRNGRRELYQAPDASGAFPNDITVRGRLAFAGYGITAPELNYDDYAGFDVRGKVVLIFDHEPQETDPKSIFNGTGNTRYATSRVKVLNAQKHGAAAVLVVAEPNRKHPSNQERIARMAPATRVTRFPSQAIEGDEVRIPLYTISDKLAADLLRSIGKPGDLQAKIDRDLKPASADAADVTVELTHVNSERRRAYSANVIGLIEGSDPLLRNETVIFSGHFDHNGPAPDGGYFPGADDNGSGTVGVVDLARAFAKNPVKPKRSILFAVFAAEERGLLGSYYYAQHPLRPLPTTRAVINFDMIGRNEAESDQTKGLIEIAADTSNEVNLVGAKYSPDYRKTVEHWNEMTGLRLNYKWDEEAALNVFFRSDQFPFTLHDIPAMWWFTGFHPDYHQKTDTVERINFEKMARILKLAYLAGWDFAETPKPPKFIPNPAAGS